jgi:hypothetical protein
VASGSCIVGLLVGSYQHLHPEPLWFWVLWFCVHCLLTLCACVRPGCFWFGFLAVDLALSFSGLLAAMSAMSAV